MAALELRDDRARLASVAQRQPTDPPPAGSRFWRAIALAVFVAGVLVGLSVQGAVP